MTSEWDDSFFFSVFKGKDEAIDTGNYRGLNLTQHVLMVVKRIIEVIIRDVVNVDDMQFGFMSGRHATDVIFILRQIHFKTCGKKGQVTNGFQGRGSPRKTWSAAVTENLKE